MDPEAILAGLNDEQREAAMATSGPVVILAGAGIEHARAGAQGDAGLDVETVRCERADRTDLGGCAQHPGREHERVGAEVHHRAATRGFLAVPPGRTHQHAAQALAPVDGRGGRGHGGYGSRAGSKERPRFEGGQNPIHMRMRKLRGPHMKKSMPFEPFRTHTQAVNLQDLERRFDKGDDVTLEAMKAKGLATRKSSEAVLQALKNRGIKTAILSNGNTEMLNVAVRGANFQDLLDAVLSVDSLQTFKIHSSVYQMGLNHFGVKV